MLINCSLIVWCLDLILSVRAFVVPKWDRNYHVKATFRAPEVGVEQPFDVWYAAEQKRARIQYYYGMVKTYQTLDEHNYGTEYNVFPVTNQTHRNVPVCVKKNGSMKKRIQLQPAVYPVEDLFTFVGYVTDSGDRIQKWMRVELYNGRPVTYIYLIKCREDPIEVLCCPLCVPIRLEMFGRDLLLHNNIGLYVIDYHIYTPDGAKPHTVFPPYTNCQNEVDFLGSQSFSQNSVDSFLPGLAKLAREDRGFDAFTAKYGVRFESADDFRRQFRKFKREAKKAKANFQTRMKNFIDSKNLRLNVVKYRKTSRIRLPKNRLPKKNRRQLNDKFAEMFTYTDEDRLLLLKHPKYDLRPLMNPVQSQMHCSSCWAFSTTAALEVAYYKKHGVKVKLSEQVLIDCTWGYDNVGCSGGNELSALDWIKDHQGVPFHIDYGPYKAKNGYCMKETRSEVVRVKKYKIISSGDILGIQIALIKYGPVIVTMHSHLRSFWSYQNGIYNDPECSSLEDDADHSALIVGYGFEGPNMYWIIRNSWSKLWGENGYARIMAMNNACGLWNLPRAVLVE